MEPTKRPNAIAEMELRSFWELIFSALLLGSFGALSAIVFLGVTGVGAHWYGKAGFGWFEGEPWWIAAAVGAGLIVGLLRRAFTLPARVPGLAEDLQLGTVDVKMVPRVAAVSAVSLIGGASLGPEAALSQIGGGAGTYLSERRGLDEESEKLSTRTGIAGTFGGLFSSSLMASILVFEIGNPSKSMSAKTFLACLVASAASLGIYFTLIGTAFLGLYEVPQYDYQNWHLLAGIGLGIYGGVMVLLFTAIMATTDRLFTRLNIPTVPLAMLGGLTFGLLGFMLPLTNFTGTDQLASILAHSGSIGIGLLAATTLGKMFAVAVCSSTGFIGGKIFPVLFIGGAAGLVIHLAIPEIPLALAFTCVLAAVPGAAGGAPFSLILITVLLTQIGTIQTSPVVIAVATSYVSVTAFKHWASRWRAQALDTKQ